MVTDDGLCGAAVEERSSVVFVEEGCHEVAGRGEGMKKGFA